MGTLEGTAAGTPDHGVQQFENGQTESIDGLVRLQAGLAEAACHAHGDLAAALLADATRTDLVAVLTQLEPPEAIVVMGQIATLLQGSDRHEVLTGLLAAEPSNAAQALRDGLVAQTRQALLGRIFSPTRVQALKRACRNLNKENS